MAVTGLAWTSFLLIHLAENSLLICSPQLYNQWAHFLMSLGYILYAMELGLVMLLGTHLFLAITLTLENKKARSQKYAIRNKKGDNSFAARTMIVTGMFILFFLIWHIKEFKLGDHNMVTYDGVQMIDFHALATQSFSQLWFMLSYVFVMIVVGLHLSHGVQSAFQSLGFNHPKYTPCIKKTSLAIGIILTVGFSAIAILSYLKGGV